MSDHLMFKYWWTNILDHLVWTSPNSWKAPDDPESLFSLKEMPRERMGDLVKAKIDWISHFSQKDMPR